MSTQVDFAGKVAAREKSIHMNLKTPTEIKSFVATVSKDMTGLSAYMEKSRKLIEDGKIYILLNEMTIKALS
jgi:hypothetical protein